MADRGEAEIHRNDPFQLIKGYWGEDLSPELIERMCNAPTEQVEDFCSLFYAEFREGRSAPLPRNHLRPEVRVRSADAMYPQILTQPYDPANVDCGLLRRRAFSLLLYCHSVAIDISVIGMLNLLSQDERRSALLWLSSLETLFKMNCIEFVFIRSPARHPTILSSLLGTDINLDQIDRAYGWLTPPAQKEVDRLAREFDGDLNHVLREMLLDTVGSISIATRDRFALHPLMVGDTEVAMLEKIVAGTHISDRQMTMFKMASLDLPDMGAVGKDLVTLRRNSEVFADWRSKMAEGLNNVSEISIEDEKSQTEAREALADSLMPMREKVIKEAKKSNLFSLGKTGLIGFGVSGVAVTTASIISHNIVAPLVTAGVTQSLTVGQRWIESSKLRRQGRAIENISLALTRSREP